MLILLELEHERFAEVLDVLETELDAGDHSRGLLNQCLAYLLDFADTCHHPKEDLIDRKLQQVLPMPNSLETEHQRLHDLTQDLALHTQYNDAITPRLIARLRQFVEVYRRHIAHENSDFFPLARRALGQDDFDAIDFGVFDDADPIYDTAGEARFAALRKEIIVRRS